MGDPAPDAVDNSACGGCSSGDVRTWTEIERRGDYEVASVRQHIIGGERAFCEDCVRTHPTDALRAVLDEHYGRQRALKPVPVAPPPPSAEELAEREQARREKAAVLAVARGLFKRENITTSDAKWAERLLQGVQEWLALRPQEQNRA
jgi:hypothetical protein